MMKERTGGMNKEMKLRRKDIWKNEMNKRMIEWRK